MTNNRDNQNVELMQLDIASCSKMALVLYAFIGLLVGAMMSLFALISSAPGAEADGAPFMGFLFGIGAIVFLPAFYGILGAVGAAIGAALYNLCAGWIGGIRVTLASSRPADPPPA